MPKSNPKEKAMEQVQEGAKLSMAFKSEAGGIIVDHLVKILEENLMAILNGQKTMTTDQILTKVSECHGVVSALSGMGDKIRYVTGYVARRNADQSLGVTGLYD